MKSRTDWIVFVKLEFDLSQLWLNQNKYVDIYSSARRVTHQNGLLKQYINNINYNFKVEKIYQSRKW